MSIQLNAEHLNDVLYELSEEVKIYPNYSGRSMYGKSCFGIVTRTAGLIDFVQAITRTVQQAEDDETTSHLADFSDVLSNVATDNMAYDYIYYWPSVELINVDELDSQWTDD